MSERLKVHERAMYARINTRRVSLESYPPSRSDAILFLDVNVRPMADLDRTFGHIRNLDPLGLGNVRTILIRWPYCTFQTDEGEIDRSFSRLGRLLPQLQMNASVGFITGNLAEKPSVQWGSGALAPSRYSSSELDSLLLKCREIEIATLIERGNALWKPQYYHYRLPSARHSGTFVRLADAIRTVRDAEVLAWWLRQHAAPNLGIIVDTSTVMSVVLALQAAMIQGDMTLGRVETLGTYPAAFSSFVRSIRDISTGNSSVLALLSVSSSGSIRDKLVSGLHSVLGDGTPWTLHTFVDKADLEPFHLDSGRGMPYGRTSVWYCLADEGQESRNPSSSGEAPDHQCRICRDRKRGRIVQIDPHSFDGLVLPEPELVTPDINFADSARTFWTYCDKVDAIELDVAPHPSVTPIRRHRGKIGVRIDFDRLLREPGKNLDRSKFSNSFNTGSDSEAQYSR